LAPVQINSAIYKS